MKKSLAKLLLIFTLSISSAIGFVNEAAFVDGGIHKTSGYAKIVQESDGTTVLKIRDFTTDTGPDVRVYLSKGVWPQEIVDLGSILAFSGDQEYIVPAGVNLNELNHVVIWCKQFDALFGYAKIEIKK